MRKPKSHGIAHAILPVLRP
uniref:Uncharacterized protein n=1 Tax=Arundo donax TaxID=35708 RepID=A0A0A9C391_ARUDO